MALRKLFAAALVTALPLAALAQAAAAAPAPLVTIYGTLNVNLQYTEAGDSSLGSAGDVSSRMAVSTDSTNIGFRGGLDVVEGLKVVYQCETAANLDGIGVAGICGRNSRVGLSGGWGTLFYGNWDTPYKAGTYGTKADDPFGNTDVFAFQGIMGSPGFYVRSGAFVNAQTGAGSVQVPTTGTDVRPFGNANFDIRAGNSVAYWSPKFGPASFKLQYSTNEFRDRTGKVDPALYSAAFNVDLAGLSVVAAGEYHEDAYGLRVINRDPAAVAAAAGPALQSGSSASKDMAWRLSAGYELPLGVGALTVMGMLEQLSYSQDDASGVDDLEDFDRVAWLLGAKFRMASHEFRARYSMALEANCTFADGTECADDNESGASQIAVGYAYHLAKSTQLYAFYTQIFNDDAASYTFSIGGSPEVVTPGTVGGAFNVGLDPIAIGVGMRYAF